MCNITLIHLSLSLSLPLPPLLTILRSLGRNCHFSYTFDYDTRHVDYATEVPPLPEVCRPLLSRALASLPKDLVPAAPDQLTINEYTP